MKKNALFLTLALCLALVLCSCGTADAPGVSGPASDVSSPAEISDQESAASEQSGGIDIPWEIPEDIENPSQGLELAEKYAKDYGDCYIVTGIGTCEDVDIVIPSTVNGKPIVEIADNAFLGNNNIKSVYCGNRVTKIGKMAFQKCKNLKKAVIPDSVTALGNQAFCDSGVQEVTLSDRIATMGRATFSRCQSLKSVKLPRALTVIPEQAFVACTSLKEVELGPNVTAIESRAFAESGLKTFRLTASVKTVDPSAFNDDITMPSFQSFEVDEDNPYLCSVDGVLYSKDKLTLIAYPQNHGDYTVPDGVKLINSGAFYMINNSGCVVTLPESMRTISENAFFVPKCRFTLNIKKGVTYIGDYAFTCMDGNSYISFEGTKEEWEAIGKAERWYAPYLGAGDQTVIVKCSDGTLTFEYKMP